MTEQEMLDRLLTGEPVEATGDVRELADLAREIEMSFHAAEPSGFEWGRGLALEAFRVSAPRPVVRSRVRRVAARILVAAALLLSLPTVAWGASEDSLPGDLLYPVKRAFEQVRLMVAGSAVDEAAVLLDQAAERLGEAARARALGLDEVASLAVDGYDEAIAGLGARIEEARMLGLDLPKELAVVDDLIADHDALVDAVLGPTADSATGGSDQGDATDGSVGDARGQGDGDPGSAQGDDTATAPGATEEEDAVQEDPASADGTSEEDGLAEQGAGESTEDGAPEDATTEEGAEAETWSDATTGDPGSGEAASGDDRSGTDEAREDGEASTDDASAPTDGSE